MLFAYSGLRSNCLLSPPSAWGDTTQTRIGLREVALIGKTAGACDLGVAIGAATDPSNAGTRERNARPIASIPSQAAQEKHLSEGLRS